MFAVGDSDNFSDTFADRCCASICFAKQRLAVRHDHKRLWMTFTRDRPKACAGTTRYNNWNNHICLLLSNATQISVDHHSDEFIKAGARLPIENLLCFSWIS